MEKNKKNFLALAAFGESVFLGVIFTYLFTWKAPGVGHLIYFVLVLAASFIPVLIIDPQKIFKQRTLYLLALPLVFGLLATFIYRLDAAWVFLAYITLPIFITIYLSSLHIKGTLSNFGIFSYVILPFKLFAAWFVDSVEFLKSLSFKFLFNKNSRVNGWGRRVLIGFVISIPFAIFFLIMFSLADNVFAERVGYIVDAIVDAWFEDFESFVNSVSKIVVGLIVTIYFSVYNFSLWFKESKLKQLMRKNLKKASEVKSNWDVIIVSTVLFVLNLVFVTFVIFQFIYLFGGSENVIGESANFTYAQYARKGFWELLFVSITAYLLILILNLKVELKNVLHKAVFYSNYIVLVLSVLIINYSSHTRLSLYEEIYGFTGLRIFVHLTIIAIAAQYLFLSISPFFKNRQRFISFTTGILAFVFYSVLLFLPMDYYVAKKNLELYREKERLDVGYMLYLSDEAIPVLVDISDEVPESTEVLIKKDLKERYERIKVSRQKWMSYNISYQRNKDLLEEFLKDEEDLHDMSQEFLNSFVDEYAKLLVKEDFEKAFEDYWISQAVKTDLIEEAERRNVDIISYERGGIGNINSLDSSGVISVYIDVKYSFHANHEKVTKCVYNHVDLKMTGEGWKVIQDYSVPIAYLEDNPVPRVYAGGFFSEYSGDSCPEEEEEYYWEY